MVVRLRLARFGRKVRGCGSTRQHECMMLSNAAQPRSPPPPPPPLAHRLPPACVDDASRPLLQLPLQNLPFYRIFAADARCPRDGRHLEELGHYDPIPGGWVGLQRLLGQRAPAGPPGSHPHTLSPTCPPSCLPARPLRACCCRKGWQQGAGPQPGAHPVLAVGGGAALVHRGAAAGPGGRHPAPAPRPAPGSSQEARQVCQKVAATAWEDGPWSWLGGRAGGWRLA